MSVYTGFGQVDPRAIIGGIKTKGTAGLVFSILLANTPQAVGWSCCLKQLPMTV